MRYRYLGIAALLTLSMALTGCGGNAGTNSTGTPSSENTASTAETPTEAQAPGENGEITYAPSEEILNAPFSSGLVQIGNDVFKQGGYMTVSQFIKQYGDKYDCSEIEPDLGIETNNLYFFYYKVWSAADPNLGIELYTTPTPDNNGNGTINDAVITRFAPTTKDGSAAPCWRPHEADEATLTIGKYVGICQSEDLSETAPYSNNGAGLTIDGLNEHINTYSIEYDKATGSDPLAEKYDSVLATVELTDVNLYGVKPIMTYFLAVYHKASGDEPAYSLGPYYTGHEVFHN